MQQVMRTMGLAVCAVLVGVSIGLAAASPPQAAAAGIEGRWVGKVTADAGEMKIEVEIKVEGGKATGAIRTAHGDWPVKGGTFANGTWTLPFEVEGAGDRWMKGVVKADTFTGEWNNAPMAVGTFELTRAK